VVGRGANPAGAERGAGLLLLLLFLLLFLVFLFLLMTRRENEMNEWGGRREVRESEMRGAYGFVFHDAAHPDR
jgi:hypothetical protein